MSSDRVLGIDKRFVDFRRKPKELLTEDDKNEGVRSYPPFLVLFFPSLLFRRLTLPSRAGHSLHARAALPRLRHFESEQHRTCSFSFSSCRFSGTMRLNADTTRTRTRTRHTHDTRRTTRQ
jgi:hypothetical protein